MVRYEYIRLCSLLFLFHSLLSFDVAADISGGKKEREECYSVYHLQQQLLLQVRMGEDTRMNRVDVDLAIHVRQLSTNTAAYRKAYPQDDGVREQKLFAFKIQDLNSPPDSDPTLFPPFLVRIAARSGELMDLRTLKDDASQLEQSLGIFDLFQFVPAEGEYSYRNANGRYKAVVSQIEPGRFERTNLGYEDLPGQLQTRVDSSRIVIQTDATDACFYRQAEGSEGFTQRLSEKAWVKGEARIKLILDESLALDESHPFLRLDADMSYWPGRLQPVPMDPAQAALRLEDLLKDLDKLKGDDEAFLKRMKLSVEVWPLFPVTMAERQLDSLLTRKLFWALSRIDSPESVEVLSVLATSGLNDRDRYRAISALYNTQSPLSPRGLQRLSGHLDDLLAQPTRKTLDYTWMRMIGGLARSRQKHYPEQARFLKTLIYTRMDSDEASGQSALVDAIGNLGESIDAQGETLLAEALASTSAEVIQSAAEAYGKLPYKPEYGDRLVTVLDRSRDERLRQIAVHSLGQATPEQQPVRRTLMELATGSRSPSVRAASLGSLERIGIEWQPEELDRLSKSLSRESNPRNQQMMATIILRARQKDGP